MRDFKNLLVTGGCGFIGSNFIRYLLEQPDFTGRVINLDKLTYAANPHNLDDIMARFPERYLFVAGDICNRETLEEVFSSYQIDSVCHFAAESHVDRSIASPDAFIQTNVFGTFTLLEVAKERQSQLRLFHHISTDEVFGSLGDTGFFTETTPYHPNNPYSASKAASDHLVRAYATTFQLPVTVSNCSNNYGPFQFPEKLIPLCVLNALEGKSLPIYGDGQNMRDWLYVEDHCSAIWKIMQGGAIGETYNVGGNNDLTNVSIVEGICDTLDEKHPGSVPYKELITYVKDRPGHDWRYAIDAAKLMNELAWEPKESFETGLEKTVSWYLDNPDWTAQVRNGEYRLWVDKHYDNRKGRTVGS